MTTRRRRSAGRRGTGWLLMVGLAACADRSDSYLLTEQPVAPPAAPAQATQPPVATDSRRIAALEDRLAAQEEQIRQLTGRLEESEHANQELAARLSHEAGAGAPSAAQPRAGEVPVAPEGGSLPTPDAAAQKGQVLGTLPREAIPAAPSASAPTEPPRSAALTQDETAKGQYEAGLRLLETADWAAAEAAFDRVVKQHPDDPLASSAAYWIGETYFQRKDYQNAAAIFARNFRTYGADVPRAPDNLLKLGMTFSRMSDKPHACQTFAELDRRFPKASAPIRQTLVRERAAAGCG